MLWDICKINDFLLSHKLEQYKPSFKVLLQIQIYHEA